jgi:TPR repeat protein
MRHSAKGFVLLLGLTVLSGLPGYAQNKTACELLSKADAEAVLGVTLQPPKPTAPFRSLLDPDFTSGAPDQACSFTNFVPNQPKPPKVVAFLLEVRYSATPDAHAVDEAHKQVDTRTYDHPTDLPGLGDASFWIGPPNNVTLFVFLGGTTRLLIGPSEIGLDEEKALAAKALASLGKAPSTYSYGTQPTGLKKPVPAAGPNPSPLDQLKRALTAKADAGDTRAQTVLGKLYESGNLGKDGKVQHDYAGAAYWYHQASDHGDGQAAYELSILYHDGLGVPADAAQSFQLLQKAAEANYVPSMVLLSDAYAEQKTPVSAERATDWARRAAEGGDPAGWLILGFEYNAGDLGGDRPFWYTSAMAAFKKAADGGNCIAMMEISDLYSKGNGVPADKTLAQTWQAKAASCQGGDAAMLQQQISQFQARAAAARQPALVSMFAAIPDIPKSAPPVARNGRSSYSGVVTAIAVAAVVAVALSMLLPDNGPASTGGPGAPNFDNSTRPNWDPDFGKNCQAVVGDWGITDTKPVFCQY